MTDTVNLRIDFDVEGIWLIEDDPDAWPPRQLGHISWAVIARHIHPHLEYYDIKKKVMKDE